MLANLVKVKLMRGLGAVSPAANERDKHPLPRFLRVRAHLVLDSNDPGSTCDQLRLGRGAFLMAFPALSIFFFN